MLPGIRRSFATMGSLLAESWLPPESVANSKVLRTAVVGEPNAGKSVLVNRMCQSKVSAVSPKYNTTRERVLGVHTTRETQVIFYDTPGFVKNKYGFMTVDEFDSSLFLGSETGRYVKSLVTTATDTVPMSDVVLYVVDIAKRWDPFDIDCLRQMASLTAHNDALLMLVLNKCDLLARSPAMFDEKYSRIVDDFEQICFRAGLVPPDGFDSTEVPFVHDISARFGQHVPELMKTLQKLAIPGPWEYPSSFRSSRSTLGQVEEVIREQIYQRAHKEVPYLVQQENRGWTDHGTGGITIVQDILVPTKTHRQIVRGRHGKRLEQIRLIAERSISKLLQRPVQLQLHVSVRASM